MFFYKNLSLMGLLLVITILYTMRRRKEIQCFIAGVLFASAVLACPSLILLWLYYVVKICVKEKEKRQLMIIFSSGAVLVALLFGWWILSHSSVETIVECVPYVFGDKTHQGGLFKIMKRYAGAVVYMLPLVLLMMVYWMGKKKRKVLDCCLIIALILSSIVSCYYTFVDRQYSFVTAPICLVGYFLYRNNPKENRTLFWNFYMIGIWYAVVHNLVSNTGRYAIYMSMFVSTLATLLMIGKAIEDNVAGRKHYIASAGLLLALLFWLKIVYVFPEATVAEQNNLVTDGTQKGMYISDDSYENYLELQELSEILSGKSVAVLDGRYYWLYLNEGVDIHNYSTYNQMGEDDEYTFLVKYFEMFGNPDYILISETFRENTFEALCEKDYQMKDSHADVTLLKRVEE